MKQWIPTVFVLLAIPALTYGCRSATAPEPQEPVRPFTATEREIASAGTSFAFGLLRELHDVAPGTNLLVSPLSVSMSLGLALNGAEGETLDALRAGLGFGTLDEGRVNEAYRGLIAQLRARDPRVEFRLANSVWYMQGFPIRQPFLDAARQHFGAHVAALDFTSPAAARTISTWAEQQTGGRIRNLVERIEPLDRLFLVNAVYFKAPWAAAFDPAATRPGAFTRRDGSVVDVPLMRLDRALPAVSDAWVQAVELEYADSAFAMVLLAPAAGSSLDDLVAALSPERWQGWLAALRRDRVLLTVPRFRYEYNVRLNEALEGLGMGIAFDPWQADFSRVAPITDLHISRVQHKTFIDVHELGTEAAAATSVVIGPTSLPPEFRFDRPFLFVIHERESGTIIFLGRMEDPSR